jgi:hypothetical protein
VKQWWRRWTYEVPLAIGDALWEVCVVQLAARLDRLTLRRVIACIPVAILVLAYYHKIPIPPELMLLGDLLAYIDVFSLLFLLGVLSRVTTILFVVSQAMARIAVLVGSIVRQLQDVRHRRERGTSTKARRKPDRSERDRAFGSAWGQVAIA